MILTKTVETSWHTVTKKWYESKCYTFTNFKDKLVVRVEDLAASSNIEVKVQCDYCGEIFTRTYGAVLRGRNVIAKDACVKCRIKKFNESSLIIYGTEFPSQNKQVREKVKNTVYKNYGVEHISQSQEIKDKIKETCLSNFGVEYSLQDEGVRNKGQETMLDLYGVKNSMQSKEIQEKAKATNLERYGVEYPMQSDEILKNL